MKLSIAAYAILTVNACAIPDVSDIHLAECLDACSYDVDACIWHVDDQFALCQPDELDCIVDGLVELSGCVSDMSRCASDCTRELQESLT